MLLTEDNIKQEVVDSIAKDGYMLQKEDIKFSITSYSRGWKIYFDGKYWRYSDNDQIHDDSRPCKRCGRMPTSEGYDACLGHIKGAKSACCGHGVEEKYIMINQNVKEN